MLKSQLVTDYENKKRDTQTQIIETVIECDGIITAAAAELGVGYRTLHRLIDEDPNLFKRVQSAKRKLRKEGFPQKGKWEVK